MADMRKVSRSNWKIFWYLVAFEEVRNQTEQRRKTTFPKAPSPRMRRRMTFVGLSEAKSKSMKED